MTARYTSGTYTSPINLLSSLDTYLVDVIGWTRNMGPTAQSGKQGRRAHYQKVITKNGVTRTVYWNLWAAGASEVQGTSSSETPTGTTYIGLYSYPSTGYDAGLTWDRQPGYPVSQTSLGLFPYCPTELAPTTPPRYVFFGNLYGDVYCLIEKTVDTGTCSSIYAGVLNKSGAGAYLGGEFAGASRIPGSNVDSTGTGDAPFSQITTPGYANTSLFIRAQVDAVTDWVSVQWRHAPAEILSTKTALIGVGNVGHQYPIYNVEPNTKNIPHVNLSCQSVSAINGVTLPREMQVAVWRSTKGKFSLLGSMPLASWCPIVFQDGLPWGTVLQDKFYSNFLALERRDE